MHWQCRHRQGCPLSNFVFWQKSDIADGIVLLAGIPTKQFTAEFIDPMAKKAVVYSSSFRMISWIIASTFEFSVLSYQRWKPESCTLRGKWSGNHESILKRDFENFRTVMSTVAFRKHAHTQRMRKKRASVVKNAVKTLCAGSLGSHANNITSLLPVSVLRPSPSRSTRYTSILETSWNRDLNFCLPLSNSFSAVQLARDRFMPAVSVLVQCAVCPAHWSVLSGHVWLRACGTSTFEAVRIVNNFEFQIRPRRFSLVRHGFV